MNYTDIKTDLVLNKLTKAQYESLLASGRISDTELYYITDDNNRFYTKDETFQLIKDSIINIEPNPEVSENAALLTSITIGETDYKLAGISTGGTGSGTNVVANPELTGDETKLRGITIADTNYSVMASEMSFSDVPVESELKLANIQIGNDNWSLVSEAWVNQKFNTKEIELKNYTDTRVANLINSAPETLDTLGELASLLQENDTAIDVLNSAIASKANASEVYTKTEIDSNYLEKSSLDANPNVNETTPRLESLRVNGTDYVVSPEISLTITGSVEDDGTKTIEQLSLNDDVWVIPNARDLTPYAKKEYVNEKISELINSAPETLDTLGELATALEENESIVDTLNSAISNKADIETVNDLDTRVKANTTAIENMGQTNISILYSNFSSSQVSIKVRSSAGSSQTSNLYKMEIDVGTDAKFMSAFGLFFPLIEFNSSITDNNDICYAAIEGLQNSLHVRSAPSSGSTGFIELYVLFKNGIVSIFSKIASNQYAFSTSLGFPITVFK